MAKSIQALRERRNALAGEVRNILDKHPGAEWKTEHQTEYDNKCGEIEALDNEIKREQRLIDLTADAKRKEIGIVESGEPVEGANLKPRALFAKFLRVGDSAFTPEEAAAYRNTMSTTTGSEGGYTVQTEVASELIKA
jgi:HK97 family phage major capsid protein